MKISHIFGFIGDFKWLRGKEEVGRWSKNAYFCPHGHWRKAAASIFLRITCTWDFLLIFWYVLINILTFYILIFFFLILTFLLIFWFFCLFTGAPIFTGRQVTQNAAIIWNIIKRACVSMTLTIGDFASKMDPTVHSPTAPTISDPLSMT